MSITTYPVRDSLTMLRRNLRRMRRNPSMTVILVAMPILFLLLFVYVFGGTLGAGLGSGVDSGSPGRSAYLAYVVPGILLMTIASAAQGTAISVAMDMTEGIIARFRTMAIARVSVLTGHVIGSLIQSLIALTVVMGVAVALGFRPTAGIGGWLGAVGVLMLISLALTWLTVAIGLGAKSVESASNLPMPLVLLPFLGSGFVPTDSMPSVLAVFAEYQPFTPVIETVRGLLMDTPVGDSAVQAVAWSVVITAASYVWAKRIYNRDRA